MGLLGDVLRALVGSIGQTSPQPEDNSVTIEYLDPDSSTWKTWGAADDSVSSTNRAMKQAKAGHPDRRVRAVDRWGNPVDFLT